MFKRHPGKWIIIVLLFLANESNWTSGTLMYFRTQKRGTAAELSEICLDYKGTVANPNAKEMEGYEYIRNMYPVYLGAYYIEDQWMYLENKAITFKWSPKGNHSVSGSKPPWCVMIDEDDFAQLVSCKEPLYIMCSVPRLTGNQRKSWKNWLNKRLPRKLGDPVKLPRVTPKPKSKLDELYKIYEFT
ncbi:hypothetical protein FGIG_03432 [Fasciola gigantica]|uniref:C-type lectin domain-containing protein n=1 Tax=Fasciola gigantica TaxID=46835 RepID=A0A504YQK5_FASGI|nr:hypothetical protein FGIG_03432 [Fasciola gigantica]